jgi:aminopeptidase N
MNEVVTHKQAIYLKDYLPPVFFITETQLDIDLTETVTTVRSKLSITKNPASLDVGNDLILMGEKQKLIEVKLDDKKLTAKDYTESPGLLTIHNVPNEFNLEITTEIQPQLNTELSGLYKAGANFCTQCEAEGFRRITYYLDRPDVMSKFCVTIHADKDKYPVLLSNGNLIEKGSDSSTRHYATWQDPFKKPCYLFAMFAGDLIEVADNFLTQSGRLVQLKFFVERQNLDQTGHAVAALKKAMAWDELAYGREYDLDMYMVVAVNDFNMGAMENKGLNIFNAKYVLASPATATDVDFRNIDAVIGHEYFHNWSGNRVTCRDWFQLSLKEGFTVFREQQFSQYINQSPVSRIDDVKVLLTRQFAEDAGPLAHPVRPASYIEINNFYTLTVYEKGAELIRMMQTILGPEKFRAGTDLYFTKHDGQAVTTDDFVAALQQASGVDLSQFKLWYEQDGTPEVRVIENYDSKAERYSLTLEQHTPATPGQKTKQPLYIPVLIGLLDSHGKEMPLENNLLILNQSKQTYVFENIPEEPKLSILRNFSAPVRLKQDVNLDYLAFMLAHDSDPFNRWFAAQRLYMQVILDLIRAQQKNEQLQLPDIVITSFKEVLLDNTLNVDLKAELLCLPVLQQFVDILSDVDPDLIYNAKKFVITTLATELHSELINQYRKYTLNGAYKYNPHDAAYRNCKNVILGYILSTKTKAAIELAVAQYRHSNNMTDTIAALANIASIECPERAELLEDFYSKWSDNVLVINKWLAIQAQADLDSVLDNVKSLMQHAAFDIKNPNKVYALIGGYAVGNPVKFHNISGAGYKFLADIVLQLNSINPSIAARILAPLTQWQKFTPQRRELMCAELLRIKAASNLSNDVMEITSKALTDYV